eukprot:305275_1
MTQQSTCGPSIKSEPAESNMSIAQYLTPAFKSADSASDSDNMDTSDTPDDQPRGDAQRQDEGNSQTRGDRTPALDSSSAIGPILEQERTNESHSHQPKKLFLPGIALDRSQSDVTDVDGPKLPGHLERHYNKSNSFACLFAALDEKLQYDPRKIKAGTLRCKTCQGAVQNSFKDRQQHLCSKGHTSAIEFFTDQDSGEPKKICEEYNKGKCDFQEFCDSLHVCSCCGSLRWCAVHCQNRKILPSEFEDFVKSKEVVQNSVRKIA